VGSLRVGERKTREGKIPEKPGSKNRRDVTLSGDPVANPHKNFRETRTNKMKSRQKGGRGEYLPGKRAVEGEGGD